MVNPNTVMSFNNLDIFAQFISSASAHADRMVRVNMVSTMHLPDHPIPF